MIYFINTETAGFSSGSSLPAASGSSSFFSHAFLPPPYQNGSSSSPSVSKGVNPGIPPKLSSGALSTSGSLPVLASPQSRNQTDRKSTRLNSSHVRISY